MRKEMHDMFVRPQGHTQCVFVNNTECKQSFCLFIRKPHRAPLSALDCIWVLRVGFSFQIQISVMKINYIFKHSSPVICQFSFECPWKHHLGESWTMVLELQQHRTITLLWLKNSSWSLRWMNCLKRYFVSESACSTEGEETSGGLENRTSNTKLYELRIIA